MTWYLKTRSWQTWSCQAWSWQVCSWQTWSWQAWSWHSLDKCVLVKNGLIKHGLDMAYHGLDMVLILFSNSLLAVLDWLSILLVLKWPFPGERGNHMGWFLSMPTIVRWVMEFLTSGYKISYISSLKWIGMYYNFFCILLNDMYISCGHVVRDFESEAKTRYNF
jgi:hypothetical protein